MFVVQSYAVAVVFCVITMLCWGSWANTQKLAGKRWRFELFYWDYVFGVLLMALIFAFTLGSQGDYGRGFIEDVRQAEIANIGRALLGGVIFNAANILLVAAIAIAGMSVAFPVGIGLALVLGVIVNYVGKQEGNPWVLFLGVALVTAAIILDALAYRKLPGQSKGAGAKGLILSVLCGVMMGFFYKFVADSMVELFRDGKLVPTDDPVNVGRLGPYAAMVLFSLGILLSNFLFNTAIMLKPFTGDPVPLGDYFKGTLQDHVWGVVGGMIWAVGMTFSIIAAGPATFAIAYGLGQGATLVAAIWGVFIWKEFREAPPGTNRLLGLMFLGYVVGLALVIVARVL
ncbi:MAG: multidrug DMT transporter permease [Planctomycetes bacterium]|nr:multidrug DMT transporter permease [Planctomycetota bacterium]